VLIYNTEPRSFPIVMDMGMGINVPVSASLLITLLVLGVLGAGFIEEIRRIAVVDCA
jgi:hypothetical protein